LGEKDLHNSKQVKVGALTIGGGAPILIQSMLNAPSDDVAANVAQARELAAAGCDIIRVAVPDKQGIALIGAIKGAVGVPLVADIHFDYRLALEAVAAGVDKIRLNPGNIGGADRVQRVASACRAAGVPIRIGVNGGSLERELLEKYGGPTAQALVDSAQRHVALLEQADFGDIVLSLKASSVPLTVESYRLMACQTRYPLHLGVTEAGTSRMGLVKSAAGIGSLLLDGIGDTIRVSLTAPPEEEVRAAKDILTAVGKGRGGVNLVSCPTCGRTRIDLIALVGQVEQALAGCPLDITVAVMGCAVNGPGEAREADLGIAGGDGNGILFAKGKILGKYPQEQLLPALLEQVAKLERGAI